VEKKPEIYPDVLDGDERHLNLRAFSDRMKREALSTNLRILRGFSGLSIATGAQFTGPARADGGRDFHFGKRWINVLRAAWQSE
jgi:hypothetical protein